MAKKMLLSWPGGKNAPGSTAFACTRTLINASASPTRDTEKAGPPLGVPPLGVSHTLNVNGHMSLI
jgi:hypothetical protein